jgi:hypothetical protein
LTLLLATTTTVARAQAAPGPEISVAVDPCVPVERGQLERLLAIELGTSTARGGPSASTHVWVSCGVQGIELRLEDGVTRKSMLRVLPAASFRDASSTRLLALAIAEFVVASWIELSVQPRHVVEPVGPPPSSAERKLAERVVQRRAAMPASFQHEASVSAALAVQVWSAHDGVLIGGGLRFLQLALPALAWTMSGDFGTADVDVPLGTVRLTTASVALAAALHLRAGNTGFYTGPGGRLGFTRMLGEPSDGTRNEGKSFFAPYGGLMWWNRVEYRASDGVRLALELEAGLITLPARALSGMTRVLALEGVWLTTGVSLGFAF